jgi:hypothetical protein
VEGKQAGFLWPDCKDAARLLGVITGIDVSDPKTKQMPGGKAILIIQDF